MKHSAQRHVQPILFVIPQQVYHAVEVHVFVVVDMYGILLLIQIYAVKF
jgi:hypothetical protein